MATKQIGRYPADTGKIFRNSKSNILHCQTVDSDGSVTIYVTDGFCMLQLTAAEYDKLIRPISKCDAGRWIINHGTKTDGNSLDCAKIFRESIDNISRVPLETSPLRWKAGERILTALYNPDRKEIISVNSIYSDIFSCSQLFGGGMKDSIYVGHDACSVHALFLPCRPDPDFLSAAAACFQGSGADSALQEKAAAAERRADRAAAESAALKSEISKLQQQAADLQAERAALLQQIDSLQESAAAAEPAQAPDLLSAAADRFQAIPGASVTVKGRQTAAPVIWIQGGDADAIQAAGGRWSQKKQAFYFKVA